MVLVNLIILVHGSLCLLMFIRAAHLRWAAYLSWRLMDLQYSMLCSLWSFLKKHLCICKGVDLIRPRGYKTFSSWAQNFILLINVILLAFQHLLAWLIQDLKDLKQETSSVCWYSSFMSNWNFMLSWVEHERSFISSGSELVLQGRHWRYDMYCICTHGLLVCTDCHFKP